MRAFIVGVGLLLTASGADAGCVGPTIMGVCQGSEVPWDTHPDGQIRQAAPPGFYYDKRGTRDQELYPNVVNPFTGRDANDSHWFNQQPRRQNRNGWGW